MPCVCRALQRMLSKALQQQRRGRRLSPGQLARTGMLQQQGKTSSQQRGQQRCGTLSQPADCTLFNKALSQGWSSVARAEGAICMSCTARRHSPTTHKQCIRCKAQLWCKSTTLPVLHANLSGHTYASGKAWHEEAWVTGGFPEDHLRLIKHVLPLGGPSEEAIL